MSVNRRDFLVATAAGGVALAAPAVHGAQKNKTYWAALVGSGWWGMYIFRRAIQSGDISAVAICDVDRNQLDPAAAHRYLPFTDGPALGIARKQPEWIPPAGTDAS